MESEPTLPVLADDELKTYLHELAHQLIQGAANLGLGVAEGTVMTYGPPPYRRLDCDGRALAYVRVRPRKYAVRVDITGLWVVERNEDHPLSAASAGTFFLRSMRQVDETLEVFKTTVNKTRAAYARLRQR